MHDKSNKFICPLADFFTTGHDMKTIASYFQIIKDNLQKFISRRYFQFSPIIVTDFSWALINAVIRSFNNTTFSVYINWCSNILIDKQIFKVNFIPTIIFLCYSHFIKMIAKKIKKIKKYVQKANNNKIHKVALYSTSVLQRSVDMEDFSKNLRNCYNIFNNKFESKYTQASLKAIKENVVTSSLNKDIELNQTINNKPEKTTKKNIIYIDNSDHKNYKKDSPFMKYFLKVIKNHKMNTNRKNKNNRYSKINSYFCPNIFKIIFHYIHLMPLWSKVLLNIKANYFNFEIDNLTNNPGENWFDQLKESLCKFLPVMPSEFANFMHNQVDAFYAQHPDIENIKLKNYKDHSKESCESWSKYKNDCKSREKGFYSKLKTNYDPFDNNFISESRNYKNLYFLFSNLLFNLR